MTALREAVVLPALFLTVTLIGGLRIAADVRLVTPPLFAVVLGLLLVGVLIRAGVVEADRFLNGSRTPLENASGAAVLVTLFAASAQAFNLVTPESGLLHAIFGTFFFVQLLTTLAGVRDRNAGLRSTAVLLGAAFVLRFIVLEAIYAPTGGSLKRLLTALMEGVTLGSLQYQPHAAATGYLAFAALAMYLLALFLLHPPPPSRRAEPPSRLPLPVPGSTGRLTGTVVIVLAALGGGCRAQPADPPEGLVRPEVRERALQGAVVWRPPSVPIANARLDRNPEGLEAIDANGELPCRFSLEAVGGTTPKFNCVLSNGKVVKVKYGVRNAELRAEVAASRLLTALGFAADRMYVVDRVRCAGCPRFPFTALRCAERIGLDALCFAGGPASDRQREFSPAAVERRIEGRAIESRDGQGWAWYELAQIDPARGGSPRADVDALRLLAALLAHWDNKAENQRLVCPPGEDTADGGCRQALAVVQDLGATFGPTKVDLRNWRQMPVWSRAAACAVTMEHLPWGGATYPRETISEEGRQMLLGLLDQLREEQLRDLFTHAGLASFDTVSGEGRDPGAWVAAFYDKVQQIRDGGPCPSAASLSALVP